MVKYYSPLVWGIMGVLLGGSLIIWQGAVLDLAVFLFGLVVCVTSVVGLVSYFTTRARARSRARDSGQQLQRGGSFVMPLTMSLMLIWGLLMLFKPTVWVNLSVIMLGVGIAFIAVNQIFGLVQYRRNGVRVTAGYYVFPVLLLLAGGVAIWNPSFMAEWSMIFMGCWIGAYGVSEILDYFLFKHLSNDKNQH